MTLESDDPDPEARATWHVVRRFPQERPEWFALAVAAVVVHSWQGSWA